MAESGPNGYIIQAESGVTWTAVWWKTTFTFGSESTFFVENKSFPFVWIPQRRINNLWGPIYSISRAPRKPPSTSDSISLLTLYMWAPDIYEGSPTPVTAFLSIAPKISISANMSRVSIVASYGGTLQQIFFFCSHTKKTPQLSDSLRCWPFFDVLWQLYVRQSWVFWGW